MILKFRPPWQVPCKHSGGRELHFHPRSLKSVRHRFASNKAYFYSSVAFLQFCKQGKDSSSLFPQNLQMVFVLYQNGFFFYLLVDLFGGTEKHVDMTLLRTEECRIYGFSFAYLDVFFFANQDLERFVFFDVIHAGETKKPAQVSMTFSRKPSFKVILLMEEIPPHVNGEAA